ncbi:MAG TPA: signal peptidase II [Pseudacidobacterium sp.]|nr:signal peptidase II [Pseudacidobacterium sp.]
MNKDRRGWLLLIAAFIIAFDRWTKILVTRHIPEGDLKSIIPGWLWISHVLNPGAAFSLFADSASPEHTRWVLVGFSVLVAFAVFAFLVARVRRFSVTNFALALVLGGAIGNLWDRIRYGVVTDFLLVQLHFGHWSYHWPDFNVADSAITCGAVLVLLTSLWPQRTS